MIRKELHIFFAALVFYTKIRAPKSIILTQEHFPASARYFPLMGWIVGGLSALLYWGCCLVLPHAVSILISMLLSILITGGLHEDGLADTCDGFGGGWSKEKIVSIMKDSATGVFGVIGIVMLLLLKFSVLSESVPEQLPFLLIAAHSLSRFIAISFMYTHTYARTDDTSKSKSVAKQMSGSDLFIALITGLAPLLLFNNVLVLLVMIPLLLTKWLLGRYFNKWIGGYTGDCLGATQQISELVFYIVMLISPWKYI